jgi:sialate O-acetylesterase
MTTQSPRLHLLLNGFSLLVLLPGSSRAQVRLPSLFTDNMVMQQQTACAVWGWAKAGSTITVAPSWGKQKYTAKTDAAGKWKLKVNTPAAVILLMR